jgi:hypothetical protein
MAAIGREDDPPVSVALRGRRPTHGVARYVRVNIELEAVAGDTRLSLQVAIAGTRRGDDEPCTSTCPKEAIGHELQTIALQIVDDLAGTELWDGRGPPEFFVPPPTPSEVDLALRRAACARHGLGHAAALRPPSDAWVCRDFARLEHGAGVASVSRARGRAHAGTRRRTWQHWVRGVSV